MSEKLEKFDQIARVVLEFDDGTTRAIEVVDTAITVQAGYMQISNASPDGSYPTRHSLIVMWVEDADEPIAATETVT